MEKCLNIPGPKKMTSLRRFTDNIGHILVENLQIKWDKAQMLVGTDVQSLMLRYWGQLLGKELVAAREAHVEKKKKCWTLFLLFFTTAKILSGFLSMDENKYWIGPLWKWSDITQTFKTWRRSVKLIMLYYIFENC